MLWHVKVGYRECSRFLTFRSGDSHSGGILCWRPAGSCQYLHGSPVPTGGGGGGSSGPRDALCPRCACAVRKVGYVGPIVPEGQGDCDKSCVPTHRTAQILTQPKNSDDEVKQTIFPLKIPECRPNLLFWPCGRRSPGGGWFSGRSRESPFTIGRPAKSGPFWTCFPEWPR